jgi:hypothetical protein
MIEHEEAGVYTLYLYTTARKSEWSKHGLKPQLLPAIIPHVSAYFRMARK